MSSSSRQRTNFEEDGPWPYPSIRSMNTVYSDQALEEPKIWGVSDVEAHLEESLVEQDANARPKCFRNLFQELGFMFTVMMAVSCTTFLQGVILINTATIGKDLDMKSAQITWIAAAIGLASGSFMLLFGKTADLFGRKTQLLIGMVWLSLWSLVTAFAPNGIAMNILCGFLGLGTACISPPAIGTMFATYLPGRRRNRATGALGSANPIGFIMGSLSSGLTTKYFNWRASFIFLAIFFFIIMVLAIWTMPAIPREGDIRKTVKKFDYLGTVLTIMGMGLISASLTEGPEAGWKSPVVIVCLIIGVICVLSFAFWETVCPSPLLDPAIWKNKNFTLCVLVIMFGYGSFATNQFWVSLYMQDIQKIDSLHIAIRLMPQALAGFLWSYIGQWLLSKVTGTILMGIGGLGYLTGATLLIFIRENTSYWKFLFPSLVITVVGADFQFIVSNLFVNKQMFSQASLGAGVLQTAMCLSISIGLALSTAVFGSSASNSSTLSPTDPKATLSYERAFLCTIFFAAISILLIPFMRIDTKDKPASPPPTTEIPTSSTVHLNPNSQINILPHQQLRNYNDEKPLPPRPIDVYRDDEKYHYHHPDYRLNTTKPMGDDYKYSTTTARSDDDSNGTEDETSYFPKWSWETEREERRRPVEEKKNVVYEVYVNCLKERKVVVSEYGEGEKERKSKEWI